MVNLSLKAQLVHTHTHTVVLLKLSFIIHYYMVRVYTLIAGHVVTIVMYTITVYA